MIHNSLSLSLSLSGDSIPTRYDVLSWDNIDIDLVDENVRTIDITSANNGILCGLMSYDFDEYNNYAGYILFPLFKKKSTSKTSLHRAPPISMSVEGNNISLFMFNADDGNSVNLYSLKCTSNYTPDLFKYSFDCWASSEGLVNPSTIDNAWEVYKPTLYYKLF